MRLVALSLSIALLVTFGGCVTTGDGDRADKSAEPEVVFQPEPGLTARERLRKAIGLLEVGEGAHAKAELQAYLVEEPNGKLANKLLPQIDADPEQFFQEAYGSESFLYKMRSGDSLSTVAKRFLGDAMLFHVLARYNGIENPRTMNAGQVIRVPGKPPADVQIAEPPAASDGEQDDKAAEHPTQEAAAQPAQEAAAPTEEPAQETEEQAAADEAPADGGQPVQEAALDEPEAPTERESEVDTIQSMILEAQEQSAQGDFKKAAVHLEQGLQQFPDSDLIKGFAVANYLSFAEQLAAEGDLERSNVALERATQLDPANQEVKRRLAANHLARADQYIQAGQHGEALKLLNKAEELDPQNAEIKPRLASLEQWSKAEEMYVKGEGLRDNGQDILAYEAFVAALKIDPDHAEAEKERVRLIPAVSEHHYGEGVKALSGQDLDGALGSFNKALEINPDHTQAKLKRDQTLDLKKKLEAIPAD